MLATGSAGPSRAALEALDGGKPKNYLRWSGIRRWVVEWWVPVREGEVEHLHGSRPGWRSVLGGLLHLGECSCALLAWISGFAHVLLENTCAACVLTTDSEMLSQLRKC